MNMKQKINSDGLSRSFRGLKSLHLERLNPMILIAAGGALLVLLAGLFFVGGGSQKDNDAMLDRARNTISQVSGTIQNFRGVMEDPQVQELAAMAVADREKLPNLQQYISERIPELIEVTLFEPNLSRLRGNDMGPSGYAVLDMLMKAEEDGQAPVQVHGKGDEAYLAMAVRVGDVESPAAYLLAKTRPAAITAAFSASLPKPGVFALDQGNGRFAPTKIVNLAEPLSSTQRLAYMRIPGALLRIGVVQTSRVSSGGGLVRLLLFIAGLLLLALGILLKLRPFELPDELEEDPLQIEQQNEGLAQDATEPGVSGRQGGPEKQSGMGADDGQGAINLPDLGFNLEHPSTHLKKVLAPVELVESIFRAYDIRGVVGKTLDSHVARQVGQVVGSLALEADAGPVVVARDGRCSGSDLVAGMLEGISSTGCNVVDIGAVPTGVLYFAAYELGSGTGVMITGSHNPPDYNGFKMLIGGITQAGEQITGMYERIQSGNLRLGKGEISQQDMLNQYRERISGDIQLKRPLKVVADCGNGIGGVCATDVLRAIGAEVFSLFDEVDGTFPNHHPDPSEPKNLQDLIESVNLLEADIGVAFDGDADRLGVVTRDGEIIYADRLMMLFARDVLSRVPGATIIYDVKCTGLLHQVIEEAGGDAMMYKTGHSLIKNKMQEVNAPFAGEMSGHFFFKERWYGFDCGIYAAARLLEILAADKREPGEVLNSLPNGVSTPELKVHMEEGENHAFIAEMQEKAKFTGAKINTIDGVRADFPDGWGLVRASNTTPVLVLRFDADSEEALERIKGVFKQQMLAINNNLELPI
ncbi:MAG: phosphomannomutase/phosphoglucomutase [Gammaproteobacteria bacterium]|nr:MAG: phosphomannomutase/phosphoglucomutase [Gammaproteobacteria bacterium]